MIVFLVFALNIFFFGESVFSAEGLPATLAQPQAPELHQDTDDGGRNSKRRKLFDSVRNGVVVIDVKSYGSAEEADSTAWAGTGFLVDRDKGIIVTNRHVVGQNAICTYEVKFGDGSLHQASLLYFDPLLDFAFLTVDPKDIPSAAVALEFSDVPIKVNDTIYAMGNSSRDEFSTFKGTVFSVIESLGPFPEQSFKFSGLTVGGASGSPVFGEDGKVVGILYGGKFISGVALPIRYVSQALQKLVKQEKPVRRSIGLIPEYLNVKLLCETGQIPQSALDEYLKTFPDAQQKILVVQTRLCSSPSQSVLQAGDVLWKLNDQLLGPDLMKLDEAINSSEKENVRLEVYRSGQLISVPCSSYPLSSHSSEKFIQFAGTMWHMGDELLRYKVGEFMQSGGVYVTSASRVSPMREIWKDSWFARRPIRITHVDDITVNSLDDLEKAIKKVSAKATFSLRYVDLMGQHIFGDTVSADRQPRFYVVKYDAKFDSPKAYTWNEKKHQWDMRNIVEESASKKSDS